MALFNTLKTKDFDNLIRRDWKDEAEFMDYYLKNIKGKKLTNIASESLEYRVYMDMREEALISLENNGVDITQYLEEWDE